MARLIIWNIMSLDGYFEGENKWDLELHTHIWGPELEELSNSFGTRAKVLVFGRVTYEGMRDYWTSAETEPSTVTSFMNALPKLVASRTQSTSTWNNTTMTSDIDGEIARLKAEPGDRDIFVFGSAVLTEHLLKAGLVDEVMIGIAPVSIGKGTPLFKSAHQFSLIESRPLSNGGVIVRYAPKPAA